VSDALALLLRAGQVERTEFGYGPSNTQLVDTRLQARSDPDGSRLLKSFWLGEAQRRLNEAQQVVLFSAQLIPLA
jgi:hypothetical protein